MRELPGALPPVPLAPIGFISSCYKEKFGIPRQPGLVTEAKAMLKLLPEFASADAVRGLEDFSHVWVIFLFHATRQAGWHPTVRPPRLGGNARLGVFATRSMFRPNPIGLSVVTLERVEQSGKDVCLHFSGTDLLEGTPVLDIKPYLPYADCVLDAAGGFAPSAPTTGLPVVFSALAAEQCAGKSRQWQLDIEQLVRQILGQDPRPSYRADRPDARYYAMKLYDFDLRWRYAAAGIEVLELAEA